VEATEREERARAHPEQRRVDCGSPHAQQ
jgi:hypothetical protein